MKNIHGIDVRKGMRVRVEWVDGFGRQRYRREVIGTVTAVRARPRYGYTALHLEVHGNARVYDINDVREVLPKEVTNA